MAGHASARLLVLVAFMSMVASGAVAQSDERYACQHACYDTPLDDTAGFNAVPLPTECIFNVPQPPPAKCKRQSVSDLETCIGSCNARYRNRPWEPGADLRLDNVVLSRVMQLGSSVRKFHWPCARSSTQTVFSTSRLKQVVKVRKTLVLSFFATMFQDCQAQVLSINRKCQRGRSAVVFVCLDF